MVKEESLVPVVEKLTDKEKEQHRKWTRKEEPPLSTSTSLQLYELFLNGYSCADIAKINDNKFDVGMIIDARLRHDWDGKREEHLESLYNNVAAKVKQTQMEGAAFLSDLLAAAHKLHGSKIKKFLQTGDPKDLGDLQIGSIEGYRKVAEILLNLTGQGKDKPGKPSVNVLTTGTVVLSENNNSINPQDASALLKLLAEEKEKK